MPGQTILIVDDEPDVRELLHCSLTGAGFRVLEAGDVRAAARTLHDERPSALILDWQLPGQSGFSFLQELRRAPVTSTLPVIMLSARTTEEDRVQALNAGADDYVTKPFSTRELLSRVRAVLRRAGSTDSAPESTIACGDLTLDLGAHRAWLGGREITLSRQEYVLLHFLATHPERAFTRQELLEQVWGQDQVLLERTIDVHIRRLRKALALADGEHLIETVRGIGYRFSRLPSAAPLSTLP